MSSQLFVIQITIFLAYCCMCINNDVSSFSRSKYAYTAVVLNLVCLLIYLTDVILNVIFLSWRVFWTLDGNAWNRYASFSDSSILCAMSHKGLIFGLSVKVSVCVGGWEISMRGCMGSSLVRRP